MLTTKDLQPNDVFVTHDTVIQASLLVEGKVKLDEGYVIDLFSLIEAAVLHNRLVTLYAMIPPPFDDLSLRATLLEAKVIDNLDLVGSYGGTDQCVRHLNPIFENVSLKLFPDVIAEAYASGEFHGLEDLWDPTALFSKESKVETLAKNWYIQQASPFFRGYDYRGKLEALLARYRGFFTFLLRTSLYWVVCAETFASQSIHSLRLPIAAKMLDSLETSVSRKAYAVLSRAIKADINALKDWSSPIRLYIPPIVAVLLDRCSSTSDIPDELLKLRKEFSGYRRKFTEYEQKIKNANNLSLEETVKVKVELNKAMRLAIKSEFKDTSTSILREIPKFFDITLGPDLIPSGSTNILYVLTKGTQRVNDWWTKRRVVYLLDMKKKMYKIRNYDKLFEKVFRQRLTHDQIINLNEVSAAIDKMIFKE